MAGRGDGPPYLRSDRDSIKRTARIAGLLYLLNGATGLFGYVIIPRILIVPGDATATAANILASEVLLRLAIVSELASAIAFVLLAIVLYRLFHGVDPMQASLLAAFVLVASAIMSVIVLDELAALSLVDGATYLAAVPTPQLEAQALFFLDLHRQGVIVANLFWGLWLIPFGVLVRRSGYLPRIISVFLILAGLGYLANSLTWLVLPGAGPLVNVVSVVLGALGEGPAIAWLLIKGATRPPAVPAPQG